MLAGGGGLLLENWGVILHPLLEGLDISVSIVWNTGLVVLGEELEGWVSSDLDSLGLVGSGVKLGNDNVWLILEGFTKLLPDWSELLAVSAPWGIELDEHVLLGVLDDLLELLSDEDGDWAVIALWDWLRLERWLEGSGDDVIGELGNGFNGELGWLDVSGVLVHVLWGDGSESWEVGWGDTHELGELFLDAGGNVGVGEKDLTLVGLGGVGHDGHEGGILIRGRSEKDKEVLGLSEDGVDLLLRELEDGWDH